MSVWAKNQLRFEISEKIFTFTSENLQRKIDVLLIFYWIFQDPCHFRQLWKTTPFFYNIFRFRFRRISSLRAPCHLLDLVILGDMGRIYVLCYIDNRARKHYGKASLQQQSKQLNLKQQIKSIRSCRDDLGHYPYFVWQSLNRIYRIY